MFDEDAWMEMRSETLEFWAKKEWGFFEAWCTEAHVKNPIGYKIRGNEITIYTDRPGWMIGRAGTLVEKYKKIFEQEFYRKEPEIKFVEVGGFANFKMRN